ncbi:MAG: hypothetical protein C4536_02290 [Actinobacteria bacterium]|nr:MAG: hypothetical protein C4536_02290 [Actinomycetota bacterium]
MKYRSKVLVSAVVAAAVVFTMIAFFPAASAEPAENEIDIISSEAVVLDTDYRGNIESARVVTFFGLTGEGSVDVVKDKDLEGNSPWQGVHGFTTPVVEGDTLVWRGLDVDGLRNVMSSSEIKSEEMIKELRIRIPLDLKYIYEWNGEVINDPNEITGQDGHLRLSLVMRNKSEETTVLEYEDPVTGEIKTEEVETYLPLVILPYDWYFPNDVFFNLEADPTGVVVPLPERYQVGWSIPLFPPATEEENIIWIEADVKNFALPPLVLSANFIFPQTNQRDTLPEFIVGLEMLFDGVRQMHEGLGSPETEDTLLYGAAAVKDGLEQMAAGLPEAEAALNTQLIPGVDEAVAGIGDPGTPDTLSYAIDATSVGLLSMLGGIGGPDVANSALYALSAMNAGLEEMSSGIGSVDTPDTLLYGVDQATLGLEDMVAGIGSAAMEDTLLYAMNQMGIGLGDMHAGIGSATTPDSLLYAMAAMGDGLEQSKAGIGSAATPDTLLYAMAAMADGLNSMLAGIGSITTPDSLLFGIDQVSKGISSGSASDPGLLEGIQEIEDGLVEMYNATSTSGEIWQATNLIRLMAPWTGPIVDLLEQGLILSEDPNDPSLHYGIGLMLEGTGQMIGGIGSPTTPDTLLYGTAQIKGGLEEMKAGLGGAAIPDTLLYAVAQVQGGLEQMKAGIGAASVPDTLLFAVDQVQLGLNSILAGLGTPVTPDTLRYAVAQVESGLELMKAGIGAENAQDTLLYAMSAMSGGLNEMKEGIGTATTTDSLLYAIAQVGNGLELMKAGIGAEGVQDTLLYAMAQVQHGLYQMKTGLSSGNLNDPGLKEGLIMVSAGLGDAVSGLGSTTTPDTLIYGADQIEAGLTQMSDGTTQMYDGLAGQLGELYLTESQLEAIKIRGEEFDHIMGRTEDAENSLAFIYQTPPTYNYKQGSKSSWLVAGIISLLVIIALLLYSLLMRRKPVIG